VRADGGRGTPTPPYIYPNGQPHQWTLDYDPAANGARGSITVTLDGQAVVLNLDADHKQIGAHFDRFGIITTHIDGSGQTVYFDDLTYTIGIVPEPSTAAIGTSLLLGALFMCRRIVCASRENLGGIEVLGRQRIAVHIRGVLRSVIVRKTDILRRLTGRTDRRRVSSHPLVCGREVVTVQ
jgi:hypothetical protein